MSPFINSINIIKYKDIFFKYIIRLIFYSSFVIIVLVIIMDKKYFLNLLYNYCKNKHNSKLCKSCELIKTKYLEGVLDQNTYYLILSFNSSIFRRFHYYTFEHLNKLSVNFDKKQG